MSNRTRNVIVEVVSVLGIMYAAIPSWSATMAVPPWVGLVITLVINVLGQILKTPADDSAGQPIQQKVP
jgi:hypothetical protein